jgi:hypothetical protein
VNHTGDNFAMFGNNVVNKGVEPGAARSASNVVWPEPIVFVNYRYHDEKPAADIEAALAHHLGRNVTFRDVHMRAGTAFPQELATRAARAQVMIPVIGERWDDQHNLALLQDPADWVHREIAIAFANGVAVVPVMFGARPRLSAGRLPADIRALAGLQCPHLARDYTPDDIHRLVKRLARDVAPLAEAARHSR